MSLTKKYLDNYMLEAGYTQVEKEDGNMYDLSDCTTSELAGALGWDVVKGLAGYANFALSHPITAAGYYKGFEINEQYADEVKEDLLAMGFAATPTNVIQSGGATALEQASTAFKKFLYDTDNLITNGIMNSGGGGHAFSVPRETVDRARKMGEWIKDGKVTWHYRSGGITIDTTDRSAVTNAMNALIAPDTITIGDDCWAAIQGQQNIQLLKINGEGGRFYAIVVTRTPVYRYTATHNYVYNSSSYGAFTRGCRVYMYDEDNNPIGTVSSPSPKNQIWIDVDSGNYSNTANNHAEGGHNFTINHGYDSTNDSENIPYWLVSANIGVRSAITEIPDGTQYVWVSAGGDSYDYVPLAQNSTRYGRLCGVWTQPQTRTYTVLIPASESPNGHDICSVSAWHNGTAVMSVETDPEITAVLLNNTSGGTNKTGKISDEVSPIYLNYNIVSPGTTIINNNPTYDPEVTFKIDPTQYQHLLDLLNNGDDGAVNYITNITNNYVYPVDTTPSSPEPVIGEPNKTIADVVGESMTSAQPTSVLTPSDDVVEVLADNIGICIYDIDDSEMFNVLKYLWNIDNDVLDKIKRLWTGNPIECIISFALCPFGPDEYESANISMGGEVAKVDGNYIPANRVTPWAQDKALGFCLIQPKYGSFLDYDPYTKISCYLPLIGIVDLNANDVMGRKLVLNYRIDWLSGSVLATITVVSGTINAVMYQYSGNCFMQVPLSSRDFSNFYKATLTSAVSLLSGGGNGSPQSFGNAASGVVPFANAQMNKPRAGSLQGNSGVLGGMEPYIIIERPTSEYSGDTSAMFSDVNGQPSFGYAMFNEIPNGYVEFESINLNSLSCTSTEKDELYEILTSGFYIGNR